MTSLIFILKNLNVKASAIFSYCWSGEQCRYFTSENTWLEVENKQLGCHEISSGYMGTKKGPGIKISN